MHYLSYKTKVSSIKILSASNHLFILHGSGGVICNGLTYLEIGAIKLSSARELMTSQRAKFIDIKLSNLT